MVEKINALFAIDAASREQGLNIEARQALRREQAPTVLEAIKAAVEAARASAVPGSILGKACEYALGQWPRLIRFLDYPELELNTNLAENSIRPIAVGSEELDPCRQSTSRTEGGSDSFHLRNLSTDQATRARIS